MDKHLVFMSNNCMYCNKIFEILSKKGLILEF